ncbi:hypothetical protein JY572_05415 [Myxococcus landrumensis]|uniref:Lipoprotein n=1 Tax=Myxococcus landrumensis TaxID=2813577 RepID=A0ABX7NH39_9BACT|nr:hypothetical protein JY572_05415 [Myxococcus landrumus]
MPPEALAAPPVSDDSPTAWSCTIDTLREGKECVFESDDSRGAPSAEQDAANRKTMKDLARVLCTEVVANAREGRSDATLVTLCERRYVSATEQCGMGGSTPVVDVKGRFAAGARSCYRGLSTVLQETQLMATVASSCCECAARRGCPGTGDRCYADVSQQMSSPATLACLSERCEDVCSVVLPASGAGARSAPKSPEKERSTRSGSASL